MPKNKELIKKLELLIIVLIILNVIAVIIGTLESLYDRYETFFVGFEVFSVAIFTVEYILRLIFVPKKDENDNPFIRRLVYIVSPLALIDLLALLPFYLPFLLPVDLRFLRGLRLIRLLRVLKLTRYSRALKIIKHILKTKQEELIIASSLGLGLLIFWSSFMYFLEHEAQPEAFASIPHAMWWGVATLTTVGYGDITPITPLGKFCGALTAISCVGLFALPAGIIASGFTQAINQVNEEEGTKLATCPHCGKSLNPESYNM